MATLIPTAPSAFEFQSIDANTVAIKKLSPTGKTLPNIVVPAKDGSDGISGKTITSVLSVLSGALPPPNSILKTLNFSLTSITSIGDNAFAESTALDTLVLPSTLVSIGLGSFKGCTSLTSVELHSTLSIASEGFKGCNNLLTITINGTSNLVLSSGCFSIVGTTAAQKTVFYEPGLTINGSNNFTTDLAFPSGTLFETHCFLEGTLILTPSGYKPIETLKKGDLVRTLNGDKPMDFLLEQKMYHDASTERNTKQLFNMNYPSVFQPLIMTGAHSTLVTPTPKEFDLIQSMPDVKEPVDGLYRLPAFVDEKASIYEVSGHYKVYHIVIGTALEGIFANGLLVESCIF